MITIVSIITPNTDSKINGEFCPESSGNPNAINIAP